MGGFGGLGASTRIVPLRLSLKPNNRFIITHPQFTFKTDSHHLGPVLPPHREGRRRPLRTWTAPDAVVGRVAFSILGQRLALEATGLRPTFILKNVDCYNHS